MIVQKSIVDNSLESMAPHEQFRFNSFMLGIYTKVDYAYHQYLDGQLDERYWKRWDYEIPLFLKTPGMAAWTVQDAAPSMPTCSPR